MNGYGTDDICGRLNLSYLKHYSSGEDRNARAAIGAVPICTTLAGGYQVARDGSIDALLRLHDAPFAAAWELFDTPDGTYCVDQWEVW